MHLSDLSPIANLNLYFFCSELFIYNSSFDIFSAVPFGFFNYSFGSFFLNYSFAIFSDVPFVLTQKEPKGQGTIIAPRIVPAGSQRSLFSVSNLMRLLISVLKQLKASFFFLS